MLHSFYSTFIILKLLQFNMVLCLIKIHIRQKKNDPPFFLIWDICLIKTP